MYKLLIVEDEEIIRKVLPVIIDWNSIGIEVVGTAKNGIEALKFIKENRVDLTLTDIRMPVMNGLELARELKKVYPQIKTILLSAYSEFDYARKGIEYGVYGYLLKSSDEDEIKDYFLSLIDILGREELLDREKVEILEEENHWVQREDFFRSVIEGSYGSEKEIACEGYKYKIKLSATATDCLIILIQIDNYGILTSKVCAKGISQIRKLILQQLLQRVEWQNKGFVINTREMMAIIWTSSDRNFNEYIHEIYKAIEDELELLKIPYQVSMSWGVGELVKNLLLLPKSYSSALNALEHRLYMGGGRIIFSCDLHQDHSKILSLNQVDMYVSELEYIVQKSASYEIITFFEDIKVTLIESKIIDKAYIDMFALKLIIALSDSAGSMGVKSELIITKTEHLMKTIGKYETITSMFEQLKTFVVELTNAMEDKGDDHTKRIIGKALAYIRQNYASHISLADVASHVNVHPVYLSRLFRQELNQTFIYKLKEVRIEKAKSLLKDIDLKVYEISTAVGYKKPRYFSEIFKEITGLTPLEYREKY